MTITITLPDDKQLKLPKGSTGLEIANSIGHRLGKDALAIAVDDELWDLDRPINKDAYVKILTFDDPQGKEVFWHSTAHIFAHAIKNLYPDALPTIGPAIEQGFYYDFDNLDITPADFQKIEEEMHNIINANYPFERYDWTINDVKNLKNPYKEELAKDAIERDEPLTAYKDGDFIDLCEGPHIPTTKRVKAVKLLKVSAAYWKGDQQNKQLTRIYGISFPSAKQLKEWQALQEEIAKRDHRKLGDQLRLFTFHDYSPGSPFYLPKGTTIYNTLQQFIREEYWKRGYQEVITPQLFNKKLWEQSGHWQHYKDDMFVLNVENEEYSMKPMNCPSHILIFKNETRSYRDLPLRLADFCFLHRNELSGTLGGMTRVRKFSQDDAHIFCTPEQIKDEIKGVLDFIKYVYQDVFKLPFKAKLSTKPEDSMGDKKLWDQAEAALKEALEEIELDFDVKEGEGAFYGPKIDFDVKDALNREWQLATVQLDFQMPLRMKAEYESADNKKEIVVMIHRAIFGSLERFIAVLTEHYAGKFPLWLSPEQVRILPIADRFTDDARKLLAQLRSHGIRATIDTASETINKKVRNAQLDQANYILVYGEKEQASNSLQVRTRDNKVFGPVKITQFINDLRAEIDKKH